MRVLVLVCMVVGAAISAPAPAPQFSQAGAPLQAILLQGSPQFSYAQPSQYAISSQSSQNAIPAGAQVIYLQSQPQFAYSQGAYPQGQIAYIQGAPQSSFATLQSAAVQPSQQISFQPGQQSFTTYQSSSQFNTAPQAVQQVKYPAQNVAPAQKQSSFQSSTFGSSQFQNFKPTAPKQSQSSFTQKTSTVYKQPSPVQPSFNAQTKFGSSGSSSYPGSAGNKGYVILKQAQNDNFDGSFNYNFETDHGIIVDANGYLKNAGSQDEAQVIQGSYSYIGEDGQPIVTTYIADENGFVAQGDHLPKVPEIIAKAIQYQRSLPPSVEDQKK